MKKSLFLLCVALTLIGFVVVIGCKEEDTGSDTSIFNWGQSKQGVGSAYGQIRNEGTEPISRAVITVKFYDKEGKSYTTESEVNNIPAGGDVHWTADLDQPDKYITRVEIVSVKTYAGATPAPPSR